MVAVSLLPFVIVIKAILDGIFFNKYSVITNIATKDVFPKEHSLTFSLKVLKFGFRILTNYTSEGGASLKSIRLFGYWVKGC